MRLPAALALALAVSAACRKPPPPEPPPGALAPLPPPAPPPKPRAPWKPPPRPRDSDPAKLQALLEGKPEEAPALRPLIDYEELEPLLPPAPAGWTAEPPTGVRVGAGDLRTSQALRFYRRGSAQMRAQILDVARNERFAEAVAAQIEQERAQPGSAVGAGSEHWEAAAKRGTIHWITPGRLLIQLSGSGLSSPAPLRELARRLDTPRLAKLGR